MTAFILGAGFNADAARVVPAPIKPNLYGDLHEIDCGYPLVGETVSLCFGLAQIPVGKSIESLFSDELGRKNYVPLQKLADRLRQADHYIGREVASDGNLNCYRNFFETFADSSFVTFNYDSMPETILYRLGRWYPHDGYGVPVVARLPPRHEFADKKSTSLVLHLHGSLCVRTSETRRDGGRIFSREVPRYTFDPYSNSASFIPYGREAVGDDVESQIIAPVWDKSQGLKRSFINETYTKALGLVRSLDTAVAIGYSFNDHDRASYAPLLRTLGETTNKRLVVVSPDARTIARKVGEDFPYLSIKPQEATFGQWASASFPGVMP